MDFLGHLRGLDLPRLVDFLRHCSQAAPQLALGPLDFHRPVDFPGEGLLDFLALIRLPLDFLGQTLLLDFKEKEEPAPRLLRQESPLSGLWMLMGLNPVKLS